MTKKVFMKIFIPLSAVALVAAPVSTVIACGSSKSIDSKFKEREKLVFEGSSNKDIKNAQPFTQVALKDAALAINPKYDDI